MHMDFLFVSLPFLICQQIESVYETKFCPTYFDSIATIS